MQKRNHFHRLQHKRYSKGAYHNPYFQGAKKETHKIFYVIPGVLICFFFLLVYFFSYPAFRIQSVEIRGIEPSINQEMEKVVRAYLNESHLIFFHNTNKFLFSKKKFREYLATSFAFDQLDVQLKKRILTISVKQRTSDIIWKTNGETYLSDLHGILTQKIDAQAINIKLPIFSDRNNKPVGVGDQILSEEQIAHILSFQQLLVAQGIPFKETQIDLQTGKWMGIITEQGYTILFDPEGDINEQARRLQTIIRETIKDTSRLQYIDLRFGDHVYYK
jgi:hypothetical protein